MRAASRASVEPVLARLDALALETARLHGLVLAHAQELRRGVPTQVSNGSSLCM